MRLACLIFACMVASSGAYAQQGELSKDTGFVVLQGTDQRASGVKGFVVLQGTDQRLAKAGGFAVLQAQDQRLAKLVGFVVLQKE